MPIKRRRPQLRLDAVDELISARRNQTQGRRGAPRKRNGERVGAAINKSAVLMLSALLQAYVETVFMSCSTILMPHLNSDKEALKRYRDTIRRWGNANPANIRNLFQRIGLPDVFDGLSWDGCPQEKLERRLIELNDLRNKIAHASATAPALKVVEDFRDFAERFGRYFANHVMTRAGIP